MTRDDINSLAHSKWNCKYHVVFAPKYRRMVIYKQIRSDRGYFFLLIVKVAKAFLKPRLSWGFGG